MIILSLKLKLSNCSLRIRSPSICSFNYFYFGTKDFKYYLKTAIMKFFVSGDIKTWRELNASFS